MTDNPGLSLRDFLVAVQKRPGLFVVLTTLGLALTVAFWIFAPRKYGSEGRIYVQMGRTNLNLDPSGTSSRAVTVMDAPETEIRSVMEIIKSRGILLQVAEDVGPAEVLANDFDFLTAWIPNLLPAGSSKGDGEITAEELARMKDLELAAKEIGENLKVYLEKNTSVISIYVKSRSASLSRKIVQRLMERTREHHLQVHSASNSRDFYAQEYKRQSEELDQAINSQREFRNRNGFLSLDSARATLQGIIDRVAVQMVDVDVELAESESRAEALRIRLAGVDEYLDSPSDGLQSMSTEGARSRFFELQNERAKLLSSYDADHWKVKELERQMEAVKPELDRLPAERTETSSTLNPIFEKTKVDLIALEARINGLQLRKQSLAQKQSDAGLQLAALNDRELESSLLQRNIDIARNHLAIYSQKLGEAKVFDQLDQQALSAVVISQPAVYMVKHVSPRGSIVLPAGAVLSGFVAMLVCLARNRKVDSAQQRRETAERTLESQVLVTIPKVAGRGQMVR